MNETIMEVDTEDDQILEIDEEERTNFQYFDPEIRWIEQFDDTEVKNLKKRLEELLGRNLTPTANHKWARQLYIRTLSKHGAYVPGISMFSSCFPNERNILPREICPSEGNIATLIFDISNISRDINLIHFIRNQISYNCIENSRGTRVEIGNFFRYDMWHLFHQDYRQGIEAHLVNCIDLRSFAGYRRLRGVQNLSITESSYLSMRVTNITQSTYMALYAILKNLRTPESFRGEQIIQIIHNHVFQLMHRQFDNDVFVQVSEVLICALGLGLWKAIHEIEQLEENILKRAKQFSQYYWNPWKLICKYEASLEDSIHNHESFINVASILAEYCLKYGMKEEGAVFIEEACKIWKNCGNYSTEIENQITSLVRKHPALGPRMIKLAKDCNIEYEIDYLVEEMCDINQGIHPSEHIWLDWVSKRLLNLQRYGPFEETIRKCLQVMFEYLDYGSNQYSDRAWLLLHGVVERASPDMVREEWVKRFDWWPIFHNKRGSLLETTVKIKEEILKALTELNLAEDGFDL